jgi:hypothetical protein
MSPRMRSHCRSRLLLCSPHRRRQCWRLRCPFRAHCRHRRAHGWCRQPRPCRGQRQRHQPRASPCRHRNRCQLPHRLRQCWRLRCPYRVHCRHRRAHRWCRQPRPYRELQRHHASRADLDPHRRAGLPRRYRTSGSPRRLSIRRSLCAIHQDCGAESRPPPRRRSGRDPQRSARCIRPWREIPCSRSRQTSRTSRPTWRRRHVPSSRQRTRHSYLCCP